MLALQHWPVRYATLSPDSRLHNLDLRKNDIGDEGAAMLINALSHRPLFRREDIPCDTFFRLALVENVRLTAATCQLAFPQNAYIVRPWLRVVLPIIR